MSEEVKKVSLTKNDVVKFFFRWWTMVEINHNYERMQGLSVCATFVPALKKLWKKDEDLKAALKREMVYFNTEGIFGAPALGLALSMEEEFANQPEGSLSYEQMAASINGIKTGLMGPLAGIGDTLDWATLQVIFLSLGMELANKGSWVGGLIPLVFVALTIGIGLSLTLSSYNFGKNAIAKLLQSGLLKKVLLATGIIGNFMMGSLGATYVSLGFASESAQSALDGLLPGILPIALVALVYFLATKKRIKVSRLSFGIIVLGLITSLIGLF